MTAILKPKVESKLRLHIWTQHTLFTQITHYCEDPTNFHFFSIFSNGRHFETATFLKIPKTSCTTSDGVLALYQVWLTSDVIPKSSFPDKFKFQ